MRNNALFLESLHITHEIIKLMRFIIYLLNNYHYNHKNAKNWKSGLNGNQINKISKKTGIHKIGKGKEKSKNLGLK